MLTRAEVLRELQVRDGRIVSPGKFEGEPLYAPALYDRLMEGFADFSDEGGDVIEVDDELRAEFPEIRADVAAFLLWTSEQGFFYVAEHLTVDAARQALEERSGPGGWAE